MALDIQAPQVAWKKVFVLCFQYFLTNVTKYWDPRPLKSTNLETMCIKVPPSMTLKGTREQTGEQ